MVEPGDGCYVSPSDNLIPYALHPGRGRDIFLATGVEGEGRGRNVEPGDECYRGLIISKRICSCLARVLVCMLVCIDRISVLSDLMHLYIVTARGIDLPRLLISCAWIQIERFVCT